MTTSMSDLHGELLAGGKLLLSRGQDRESIENFAFSEIYQWVVEVLIANPETPGVADQQATVSVDVDWVQKQAQAITNEITGEYHGSSSTTVRRSELGTDHTPES